MTPFFNRPAPKGQTTLVRYLCLPSNNGSDFVALFIGFSLGFDCVGVLSDELTNDTAGFLTDTGAVENRDQKGAFGGIGNDLESWAVFDLDFGVFVRTVLKLNSSKKFEKGSITLYSQLLI